MFGPMLRALSLVSVLAAIAIGCSSTPSAAADPGKQLDVLGTR
jgi:hypothetical protein